MGYHLCERCDYHIPEDEMNLAEIRHGALWCGGCCNSEDVGEAGYTEVHESAGELAQAEQDAEASPEDF